jgi:Na+-transporting NADH:ubiquinone oxidoreductase subunit F
MLPIISTSIIAFTVVILLLVLLLLLAQKQLVQSGPVKITINSEKTITVSAGSSLLSTLANEKIFLPSACGGGGTCAMCKCVVESGGGDVLPTEVGHLSRK